MFAPGYYLDAPEKISDFTMFAAPPGQWEMPDVMGYLISCDSRYMTVCQGGDATGDNRVNVDDLGVLASNYDGTGLGWYDADFTYDGVVNVDDLGILATNYDWDGTASAPGAPEPTSLSILALAGMTLIGRRRHRPA